MYNPDLSHVMWNELWYSFKLVHLMQKCRQFFQTHRAPTFKPLSEGHTIGDKIQPLQSEILNNARISASSHGWEIGHQPSIA